MRIIVNVTYSYAIIITAAKCTQESEKYKNEKTIENSRFSHKWVKGFLERGGVKRRKTTKEDKDTPTDDEIRCILKIGQDIFISKCKTKYKMSPSSVRSEGGEAAAGYCLNSVSYRVDEAVKYNVLNSD